MIEFTLSPVTNPSAADGVPFEISTYTDITQNALIDSINTLTPSLLCNFPCKECLSSDKDACTSCFTDGSFPYLKE